MSDASFDQPDADRLDDEISQVLVFGSGPHTDATVTWLLAAVRTDPPVALVHRIEADHERCERARWRPVQLVAALFALNLLSHGLGNFVVGGWVARGLGEAYSPHAAHEGGIALVAAGLAVGACALRRSWIPVSVAAGAPLGIALGLYGLPEIGEFGPGAALHIAQGTLGAALAVTWWRAQRYERHDRDEGQT